MNDNNIYNVEEHERVFALWPQLAETAAGVLKDSDEVRVRHYMEVAAESGKLGHDAFGLNPLLNDMETALLVAQEIGLTRGALLGVLLNSVAAVGVITPEQARADFGDEVSKILHGLGRIRELYAKSAAVDSENFRSLLVTFAEDLRVILIMIANRVCLMRKIRDTENVEEQRRVSMEAAYLYAPLAHKLGLYKLKSELEDLSLKYLEHDAYYHIKEKLNETKRSRDAYVARFIAPIERRS